jgi:hypothetical protein
LNTMNITNERPIQWMPYINVVVIVKHSCKKDVHLKTLTNCKLDCITQTCFACWDENFGEIFLFWNKSLKNICLFFDNFACLLFIGKISWKLNLTWFGSCLFYWNV